MDLLHGLASLGHRIDCYFPGDEHELPDRLGHDNITVIWGSSGWRRGRWYSKTRFTATASQVVFRIFASLRLRRVLARRHAVSPYDVSYEFAMVENLASPTSFRRAVPMVVHPETHSAGELKSLLAERRLSLRCQPLHTLVLAVLVLCVRTVVQRGGFAAPTCSSASAASFAITWSVTTAFRWRGTVVVPNPVRLERFDGLETGA